MDCLTINKTAPSAGVAGRVNFDHTSHESQLIKRARRGDMLSFNRLVYIYQERAYRFAYRVLGEAGAAGQATHRAFESAHQHFDGFRGDSLSIWLLRLVTRACRELQAQASRRPMQLENLQQSDHAHATGPVSGIASQPMADQRVLGDVLQQGLGSLAFEPRVILVLSDMEGYTYGQIALITGMRADAVQSHLASARKELTRFLAAHEHLLPVQYRRTLD